MGSEKEGGESLITSANFGSDSVDSAVTAVATPRRSAYPRREHMDQSKRNAGKVAGSAYLLSFAAVVFAQFRIQDRLIINRSNAETVRNILEHERFFRVGIACDLFYSVGTIVLLVALYVILRPVNRGLALFAALGRLVYALMWVLMTVNLFDALRLMRRASEVQSWETNGLLELAIFYLRARFDQYYVGRCFVE